MSVLPSNGASERKRIIRLYYWFQFTFTLLFWTPVFFEYQRRMGLSDPQIFRIQSIYYIVFCFLELPTGYLADRFGYIRSMILGAITLVLANLVAVYVTSFGGFVVHWVLVALARSFVSGASSAYLFEYLRRTGAHAEFKQIEGNARAYSLFGRITCFAVIGYLMAWHVTLPYWLTAGSAFISVIFATMLPAFSSPKVADVLSGVARQGSALANKKVSLRVALRHAAGSPWLMMLMFQGVVIFVLARVVSVNLFQPILSLKGFAVPAYGVVMAVMTFFEAIGSARPNWMRKYFSDIQSVFVLSSLMALSVAIIPFFGQNGTIFVLIFFSVATGLSYPIQKQVMNEAIPDPEYRATILSLESLIDRAVTAGVAIILERLSREVNSFLVVAGILSLLMMVAVQFVLHRLRHLAKRDQSCDQ